MKPVDRRRLQRAVRKVLPEGWTATRVSSSYDSIRTGLGKDAEWSPNFSGVIVRPPRGKLGRILVTDRGGCNRHGIFDNQRRVYLVGTTLRRTLRDRGIIGDGYSGRGWREAVVADVVEAVRQLIEHWKR